MKPDETKDSELVALRRCARDIAALAAIPAIWSTTDFNRGLQNLADVLAAVLRVRFVFIRVDRSGAHLADAVSTDSLSAQPSDPARIIRELGESVDFHSFRHRRVAASYGDVGPLQLASSQIAAVGGMRGFVLAGSSRESFPSDADKLLLSTGASQIAILCQRLTHESEMASRSAQLDEVNRVLLETRSRLHTTLGAAEIGTWTWDVVNDCVTADQNLAKLFGVSPKEARGSPIEVFIRHVHPADRANLDALIQEALAKTGDFSAEYRLITAAGAIRWVVARGRVEYDASGRAIQFPGVILDITDRKVAENELRMTRDAAEAANRAKDQFLAVLSHELRTPLSPILSTVAALDEDESLPDQFRPRIAMIRRNVELETQLIDDLLDVSRIVNGKLSLHLQPTDVHEVLEHAFETCRADFSNKSVGIELLLNAKSPLVIGDAARLQQVFWNLLRNAAKFTPVGGSVTVRTANPESGRIVIEVRDTGIGIPADAINRVFLPFEQGETNVTRKFGGLGLGLAICKAVMETHGGSIHAANNLPAIGATFTVELRTTRPIIENPSPDNGTLPVASLSRNRILLVEDHVDTAKSLAWILTKSGFQVTTANTAASALEASAQKRFDMMVSDLGLPDMDGYQLMREMTLRHALKGIALSGYGTDDDVARAREAGFLDHLVKPVNIVRLRAVLQELLKDNR